jgi:hypothetical protein
MPDFSKLKQRRTLGAPPPPTEASTNLAQPEDLGEQGLRPPPLRTDVQPRVEDLGSYDRLDGRSLRRSNRVVQFATRVTPEFDRRIREIARDEHLLIVEVLERALEADERQQPAISQKATRSAIARG